jgi:hypothetical protein
VGDARGAEVSTEVGTDVDDTVDAVVGVVTDDIVGAASAVEPPWIPLQCPVLVSRSSATAPRGAKNELDNLLVLSIPR